MTTHDSAATACRKPNKHSAATMAKICCMRMHQSRFLGPESTTVEQAWACPPLLGPAMN